MLSRSYLLASVPRRMALLGLVSAISSGCGGESASVQHIEESRPDAAKLDASPGEDAGPREAGTPKPGPEAGPSGDAASWPTPVDAQVPLPPGVPSNTPDAEVTDDAGSPLPLTLRVNEVVSRNAGAYIDERGQTGDYIELINASEQALQLAQFEISDASGSRVQLPQLALEPSQVVLLWADNAVDAGVWHLPFKLDGEGDRVRLSALDGTLVDEVQLPALDENDSLARFPDGSGDFARCRYASPKRQNGSECMPPVPPDLVDDVSFEPYQHPAVFPAIPGPLVVTELALNPAAFVELKNITGSSISLDDYQLRVTPTQPGAAWPGVAEGVALQLPAGEMLAAGEFISVPVQAADVSAIAADPAFEGVLTLFDRGTGEAVERVDFMRWPVGTTLTRAPEDSPFRFCSNQTPGLANECDAVLSRDVGDRVRYLRTPGDFAALAAGGTETGMEAVKFVLDMQAGGAVHLLSSAVWPLHYTWIREHIYQEPALDRCDPEQADEFYDGWLEFSEQEYFRTSDRRFLLGTLVHHGGADLHSIEYTFGDEITATQMKQGFFSATAHAEAPKEWVLRPQDDSQVQRAKAINGDLPIVGPNAPFEGVSYQALTQGIAYGTLEFVPAAELNTEALGPRVIVVTDDVPNDIPLVGGLVTEAFQTPLAHVNVLSQNRNTPNAALVDARSKLEPYFGHLVRIEVSGGGFDIQLADAAEAQAFWDERLPTGSIVAPRLDADLSGVQDLALHSLDSLPGIGAKAAQLAELGRINAVYQGCAGDTLPLPVPAQALAIPLRHYLEHFAASGAQQLLAELQLDESFVADPVARAEALLQVQEQIRAYPVAPELLSEVEQAVEERFGTASVRFRSSSNTEDLPHFNGAGLYTSTDAEAHNPKKSVADALRTVWASLWNPRAYDERRYAGIDDTRVAMGVLVHQAYPDEQANGVAVSRNVLDLFRGDIYYVNAQAGEASVTNPAPGVTSEQLIYLWNRSPRIVYQSTSSLLHALGGAPDTVLTEAEVEQLACALRAVHDWFRPLLDPAQEDPYFAMEVEYKFVGRERTLAIKQARPHAFGDRASFGDCREL